MTVPFPFTIAASNDNERFMHEALKEAWKAFQLGEVPVGAILVKNGRIIARGHNQVELLKDATAHAEMLCITIGESAVENWRLKDTTLYCTIEPCCMCAGAMMLSRIPKLVYGAKDIRHGAHGSFINIFEKDHPTHTIEITTGVLENECAYLLRDFFQKRRVETEKLKKGLKDDSLGSHQ
ncbi:tRNA adenosine(34) deaminase TadA [Criblamydia sequanensis]|uniref:tRNA-specific adenosine deaminase n=1 Tax=Candidatus Criblamydia sequanensis CRIB-18 TaxID=1437425 RepID=A0A090D0I0_9BACT|nr:tRNA adenosine(34) deaminase TadA [Criblamydia sequanensis]CDR33340.1 tRNA-specific adenosine deaminase [Criblamydia sequanensis CRIB-18]